VGSSVVEVEGVREGEWVGGEVPQMGDLILE